MNTLTREQGPFEDTASKVDGPIKCLLCDDTSFTKVDSVRQHLLIDHGVFSNSDSFYNFAVKSNKAKPCDERSTKVKTATKKSARILGKDQLYECCLCKVTFKSFEGISIHLKTSHSWLKDMWEKYYKIIKKSHTFVTPLKRKDVHKPIADPIIGKELQPPVPSTCREFQVSNVINSSNEVHHQEASPSSSIPVGHVGLKHNVVEKGQSKMSMGVSQKSKNQSSREKITKSKVTKTLPSFSKGISNLFAKGLIPVKKFNLKANHSHKSSTLTRQASMSIVSNISNMTPSAETMVSTRSSVSGALSSVSALPSAVSATSIIEPAIGAVVSLSSPEVSSTSSGNFNRRKKGRSKKRCAEDSCEPCSIVEDCKCCKYCCNKSLK